MTDGNAPRDPALNPKTAKEKLRASFWPLVNTPAAARKAVMNAFGLIAFGVVVNLVLLIVTIVWRPHWIGYFGFKPEEFTVAIGGFALMFVALVLLAVFVYFNSRVATILATIVYLINIIAIIAYGDVQRAPTAGVVGFFFTLVFIGGVRGAFALHAMRAASR